MGDVHRPQLFTVPLGTSLTDALAAHLLENSSDNRQLADCLILMPNNRAIKSLTDSFVRQAKGGLLLPRMVAVGDLALDQKLPALLDPIGDTASEPIAPAIQAIDRRILLTRLIQLHRPATSAVEALKLASKLASALDVLEIEEIGLEDVRAADLTDDLQAHWQSAYQDFLSIAAGYYAELSVRNLQSAPARRNILLNRFAAALPLKIPVIAAGITTAAPAIARLLKAVSRLPQGMIVWPHIDLEMADTDWDALGPVKREGLSDLSEETHPQFHLKLLLDKMGVRRDECTLFPGCNLDPALTSVDRIFASADQVLHWADLPLVDKKLKQARVMTAADSAEEALAIAMLIRHALETPEKQVSLVTPDRELAVRVSAQLKRWDIDVDDSAGQPLIQLPPATLLLGLAEMVADQIGPVSLLSVLKHPLVRAGEGRLAWLENVRKLDVSLRGPRLGLGLKAITETILAGDLPKEVKPEATDWWRETSALFAGFDSSAAANLPMLLDIVIDAATQLTDGKVWQGHVGRQLAQLLEEYRATDIAGIDLVNRTALPALLSQLLDSEVSRPVYGSHPRVAIYGLLEARLQQADLVICAGLNEGTWPQMPQPDPWLSPILRRELKLPGLERNIGLSAHDLMGLLGAKEVVLSRAVRDRSGPTIASRFLLRTQALIGAQLQEETDAISWARQIDKGETVRFAVQPKPNPSREQRRVDISVTQIETLRADPFAFYANKILGLKAMRLVGGEPDSAWRGVVIHDILKKWADEDGYAPEKLVARAEARLANPAFHPAVRILWQPRLAAALKWVAQETNEMQASGRKILNTECWGALTLCGVEVKGQADRIDRDANGGLVVVDYKSGKAPSTKSVKAGFRIQLGLLGAMAEAGTMNGVNGQAMGFEYWSLAKNDKNKWGFGSIKSPAKAKNGEIVEVVPNALRFAREAVENWIIGDAPFTAKLHPEYAYSDYDHLMRLNEWYGRQDDTHNA
jgi:ATP-dependent helicase/nuclease subunit B